MYKKVIFHWLIPYLVFAAVLVGSLLRPQWMRDVAEALFGLIA